MPKTTRDSGKCIGEDEQTASVWSSDLCGVDVLVTEIASASDSTSVRSLSVNALISKITGPLCIESPYLQIEGLCKV